MDSRHTLTHRPIYSSNTLSLPVSEMEMALALVLLALVSASVLVPVLALASAVELVVALGVTVLGGAQVAKSDWEASR